MSSDLLKKFRIRDLHDGSSQKPSDHGADASTGSPLVQDTADATERHRDSESSSRHATIQVSTSDYDEISTNHPRALLTYLDDDDDGEVITVGLRPSLVSFSINADPLLSRLDLPSSFRSGFPSLLILGRNWNRRSVIIQYIYLTSADQIL